VLRYTNNNKKGIVMKGYTDRFVRGAVFAVFCVCQTQAFAWSEVTVSQGKTVADKYSGHEYTFRPDARFDQSPTGFHSSLALTESSNDKQWAWRNQQAARKNIRPWGNWTESAVTKRDPYYEFEYQQAIRGYDRAPSYAYARSYQYRQPQMYTRHYPVYARTNYSYPESGTRRAMRYSATDADYGLDPLAADTYGMSYVDDMYPY
jgi:hypothetical protein